MAQDLTANDRKTILQGVLKKYHRVADSPEGLFGYPTGRPGLEAANYPPEYIDRLPESVQSGYCGVGNPFAMGDVKPRQDVLDIGCGVGVDTLVAALMSGPYGRVVGIDITVEMVERAKENFRQMGLSNVSVDVASPEQLPFDDNSFDLIISNGVFNLIPDKQKVLDEAFRVLKPKGRIQIADQVLVSNAAMDHKTRVANWFK